MKIDPLPVTQAILARKASADIIIYVAMAIAFIPGMVAGFIVYETETELKHQ